MYFYNLEPGLIGLKRILTLGVYLLLCFFCLQTVQLSLATEVSQGTASWYGPNFAGKPTANGEIYNPRELTAAHQSLAFNTIVRVTNLRNGQTVNVRINDRGPFVDNRIIDLSEAAAEVIDMKVAGLAPVSLRIIKTGDVPPDIRPVNASSFNTTNAYNKIEAPNNLTSYEVPLSVQNVASSQDLDIRPVQAGSLFSQPVAIPSANNNNSELKYQTSNVNSLISKRPYKATLPLPFDPDAIEAEERIEETTMTATYSVSYTNELTSNDNVGEGVERARAHHLSIDTIPGLTLQEVIAEHYPIGTQFLLRSSNGKELWVQVISNQLPPKLANTFLVSQELLNILGKDLILLEQQ